jgi:beta-N-acetylhexosaminidase
MTREGNDGDSEGAAAPRRPRIRGRRGPLGLGLAALLGGGIAVGVLAGGDSAQLSLKDRAQLEAVSPGLARRLGVPASVATAASKLPLRRQVAQLVLVGHDGTQPPQAAIDALRRDGLGGIVLEPGASLTAAGTSSVAGQAAAAGRAARGPAPLLVADQPGGPSSAMPHLPPQAQPLIGDTGSPAQARSQALAASKVLRAAGVRLTIAPAADVGTAAGPVEDRVFGDDPALVTRMTRAAVDGYRAGGLAAAVGHFPGEGAGTADPDLATSTVGLGLQDLRARDLLPFAAVVHRVPVVVMSNAVYAAFDGATPAVMLPEAITLLRKELGFKGIVMTDDLAATAPSAAEPVGRVAVEALQAGADLLYVTGPANARRVVAAVTAAVHKGDLSLDRLQVSVLRALALKRRVGLAIVAPVVRRAKRPVRAPAKAKAPAPAKSTAAPPTSTARPSTATTPRHTTIASPSPPH